MKKKEFISLASNVLIGMGHSQNAAKKHAIIMWSEAKRLNCISMPPVPVTHGGFQEAIKHIRIVEKSYEDERNKSLKLQICGKCFYGALLEIYGLERMEQLSHYIKSMQ